VLARVQECGLRRVGVVQRRSQFVWGIGDWAMQWLLGERAQQHLDGAHLMWRVRQGIVEDALPERRTVVEFNFPGAHRGRRIWLLLDPSGSSVCERDEGFDVDVVVTADIGEFLRIWMGRSTWRDAMAAGTLTIEGPRPLVRAFPTWFALSPFARRAAS
jgi:SCP-2 sterol transfer family